jgi:hypothetical protein
MNTPPPPSEDTRKTIKHYRGILHLTQRQLSVLAGCDVGVVKRAESPNRSISYLSAVLLTQAINRLLHERHLLPEGEDLTYEGIKW